MADITLTISSVYGTLAADIAYGPDDLVTGHDLANAVGISLFTDGLVPSSAPDSRGWWADNLAAKPIGSRLWTYYRAKRTNETRLGIVNACNDALRWLLDDGVAGSVTCDALFLQTGGVQLSINVVRPDGTAANLQYDWAWTDP